MDLSFINKVYVFGCAPIALVSFFFTMFTIIVLSRIKTFNVFVYFKLESLFILADCAIAVLFPLYKCKNCFTYIDPATQCIIDLVLFYFISCVVEMTSISMAILAALVYLSRFSITSSNSNSKFALLFKIKPITFATAAFILACINYVHIFFEVKIGSYSMYNDTFDYECEYNDFGLSYEASALTTISYSISYFIMLVVLIVINVVILYKLKKSIVNPLVMIKKASFKRRNKEKRLTTLMLADCLNLVIGRLPYFVWYVAESYSDEFYYQLNFVLSLFTLVTYSSFVLKFFVFYCFNYKFKKESKKLLSIIKICLFSRINFSNSKKNG